jgi:Ca-activated chloride channel family protein
MIATLIRAVLGAAWLLALGATTPASATPPLVLIIDASGSMAAELDGEPRLDIARRVIHDEAAHWANGAELGLVAYGHRRKGDCADIETMLPVGPLDMATLGNALDQLRARGKTPLSAALVAASGLLPDGGSIVLVSDGLETCDADPCAVAASLRQANVDLRIFVIGFGLTRPELDTLGCIAENGGGLLLPADSAQSLSETLSTVGEAAASPPPPPTEPPPQPVVAKPMPAEPEPAPATPAPPTPVPVDFEAVTALGRMPAPVQWTVKPAGADQPVYEGGGIGIALDLPPGRYDIALAGNNVSGGAELEITGPSDTPMPVPIAAGHLLVHLTAGNGLTLAQAELGDQIAWTIAPLDAQPQTALMTGLDANAVLAPGRYRVTATLADHVAEAEVMVGEGETTEITLSLALGRLTLELMLDDGPVTSGSGLDWTIAPATGGDPVAVAGTARPTLMLPAGSYVVSARLDGATVTGEVVVADGAATVLTLSNAAGTVTLEATLGPGGPVLDDWRDVVWTVSPSGGQDVGSALTDHAEARPVVTLVPGEWEAMLKSGAATTTQRFTVQPGIEQTIRIAQAAGRLRLSGRLTSGSEPFSDWRDVLWTVRSADGATTLLDSSPDLAPVLVVPEGDWLVTLVSGGARLEQRVTIVAGDDQSLDAALEAGRLSAKLPDGSIATLTISPLDAGGNPLEPMLSGTAAPNFATVLPAGQYLLEATSIDGRYASAPFELAPGETQQIDMTWN